MGFDDSFDGAGDMFRRREQHEPDSIPVLLQEYRHTDRRNDSFLCAYDSRNVYVEQTCRALRQTQLRYRILRDKPCRRSGHARVPVQVHRGRRKRGRTFYRHMDGTSHDSERRQRLVRRNSMGDGRRLSTRTYRRVRETRALSTPFILSSASSRRVSALLWSLSRWAGWDIRKNSVPTSRNRSRQI